MFRLLLFLRKHNVNGSGKENYRDIYPVCAPLIPYPISNETKKHNERASHLIV